MLVFEEPLFCNGFLQTHDLQSACLRASLRGAGCTKLGHLMKLTVLPSHVLIERSKITSMLCVQQDGGRGL